MGDTRAWIVSSERTAFYRNNTNLLIKGANSRGTSSDRNKSSSEYRWLVDNLHGRYPLRIVKARRQRHPHATRLIVPLDYGKLPPTRDSRGKLVERYRQRLRSAHFPPGGHDGRILRESETTSLGDCRKFQEYLRNCTENFRELYRNCRLGLQKILGIFRKLQRKLQNRFRLGQVRFMENFKNIQEIIEKILGNYIEITSQVYRKFQEYLGNYIEIVG